MTSPQEEREIGNRGAGLKSLVTGTGKDRGGEREAEVDLGDTGRLGRGVLGTGRTRRRSRGGMKIVIERGYSFDLFYGRV